MFTENDDGRGLVKLTWENVRKRVAKVDSSFAKIVDDLSPGNSLPIYLAYYPYGHYIAAKNNFFLPDNDGGVFKLGEPKISKDLFKNLGYGMNSLPMGMVLEKDIEWFIDLEEEKISIPWLLYSPGTFFPFAKSLSVRSARVYSPNNVLTMVSGARSAFMLPNIGCISNHVNLQRDFNIKSSPPKVLYEHWKVFNEILNSKEINNNWRSVLLFFSECWLTKLHKDKAWVKLKMYLHELAWNHFEYRRNHIYYDIAFSVIQKKHNLKPNPYLADTARHLFATALGAAPGYAPACSETSLPLEILQKVFVESYGLKKYLPTIMTPAIYSFEKDNNPVYYSLQNPSTHVFSPKSRNVSSTLFEMRELEYIMRIFSGSLAKNDGMCSGTIISKIASEISFKYFHNKLDRHKVIKIASDIFKLDERFQFVTKNNKVPKAVFACDAQFVRGCISIGRKN